MHADCKELSVNKHNEYSPYSAWILLFFFRFNVLKMPPIWCNAVGQSANNVKIELTIRYYGQIELPKFMQICGSLGKTQQLIKFFFLNVLFYGPNILSTKSESNRKLHLGSVSASWTTIKKWKQINLKFELLGKKKVSI